MRPELWVLVGRGDFVSPARKAGDIETFDFNPSDLRSEHPAVQTNPISCFAVTLTAVSLTGFVCTGGS